CVVYFFFSSRRRHTRFKCDWSSDVCSSDLVRRTGTNREGPVQPRRRRDRNSRLVPVRRTAGRRRAAYETKTGYHQGLLHNASPRSEERRVGTEWRSPECGEHETKQKMRKRC